MFGGEVRGQGAEGSKISSNQKVKATILMHVATTVYEVHSSGKAVVAKDVINFLIEHYALIVSRTTVGRMMKTMVPSWTPIQKEKRTYVSYRQQSIRNNLIELDKYVTDIATGTSDTVVIFMDESYCNTNHASKNAYLPTDGSDPKIDRKAGKGRRLIIIYVIGEDGPLIDLDLTTGLLIDDIQ